MSLALRYLGRRVDDFVYSRAIELLGGGADAYVRLAQRYESLNWIEEAIQTYQKAVKLRPHQGTYRLQLAKLFIRLQRWEDALTSCQEALQMNNDLPEGYVIQGTIRQKQGQTAKAIESFRKAMTYSFNDSADYNTLAKAFAEAGLYEESVQAYREIIRISPRNVAAYGIMAETYSKLKRFPEALEAYRKAVELKPSSDAYGILASAYARIGQYRQATEAYQKALELEPGFSQTWNRLSEVYIKLADFEKQTASGQLDEQTQKAFERLRKEQEALENFKEVIRQKPNDPGSYLQMGQLYLDLNLPTKAIDFLNHALRLKGTGASIHRGLGLAYLALGQNESARKSLQQALRIQRSDAETWSAMGQLHMRLGKQDEAIKSYQEAMRWKPQDPSLHRQLGDILRQAGRNADAARAYWKTIHLNPQDALARYGLGVAYVRLDQRSYALEQKAVLRTIDVKLAAELDHVIWRLTRNHNEPPTKA